MASSVPLIEVHDLYYTYEQTGTTQIEALRGVTLTIAEGEFVALVGANGSGKTTLVRHLNGLLIPARGSVAVAGLDTRDRQAWGQIRTIVGMVFQRPEDQIVATTVEDDVAFGPQNLGLPPEEIESRVRWALETVGMWEHRRRAPHLLSVGQQQRVAIAGALAMRPRCLVLDEPTAMLDPAGRRRLLELLRRLHAAGTTILLVTHRMEEAALADRVVALGEGRVAYDGSPRGLLTDTQRVKALGLAAPPLVRLAAALAGRWPDFPAGLVTEDEVGAALLRILPRSVDVPVPRPQPTRASISGEAVVSVRQLSYTYLPHTPLAADALCGIDLQVYGGEILVLAGSTGAGKSTLLEHIAGLLQPTEGTVWVAGRDVWGRGASREVLRREVGMLFQRAEEQLFEPTVGEDVAFGPRRLGLDAEAVRERARRAMEEAGLPFDQYKDRFTQGLSGGEQRMAALAGVLALRPRILLLDEPMAGLDGVSRKRVSMLLRRLNREVGRTLILASHSVEAMVSLADRVVILQDGRVADKGTPRELLTCPDRLVSFGLEAPPVCRLMQRLHDEGVPVPANVLSVDEALGILERLRSDVRG